MKIKNLILVLVFIVTGYANIFAQKQLSLNKAIEIVLNSNVNIVKSETSLKTYESSLKSAYGNLIPSLSASAGFSWQRTIDDGGKKQLDYFGNETITPASSTDSRNYSLSLGGNVTLFDGLANISTIDMRKNNLDAAKLDLSKLKQDAILQTVNLYAAVIGDQKLLKFQEENLNYNKGLLDKINEMFKLKMIPQADVYAQQVQKANAELAFLQAQNNLEKAKMSLLNYLSIDVTEDYTFEEATDTVVDTSLAQESLDVLYQTAYENRDDYASMKLQLASADNQLTIARGSYFPQLSGNYGFSTSATSASDLFTRRGFNAGLSLNFPIFSHWSTDNAVQSAEVQIDNTNQDLLALERTVKSDVKNAFLDLQTVRKQLDVSKIALNSAKENWQIKKQAYELGATTLLDLQQSYNDYLNAGYTEINTEYNYLIKQYQLLNVTGKLNGE